ncbi:hypothetical protein MIMGU_mgv1a016303mg [Erythranthe guttata]|uniref:Non-specific lipid-transfer protein n=1 Tax=Erythranthe guttata TaxID=4155 RepID=A0A022QVG2_ERYGU|nr:PREDICTED: non-specific lipid-transfer protein A-like [Erythranthe guttata]EYU31896.1 hypothetical protein MIMGU_mgv1a016303mg [Erythranthe guttata]|eukprot:XP_012843509.1 PREDICTED: non-specific lipid-transfer protein A-like [Erythranthe guttata]
MKVSAVALFALVAVVIALVVQHGQAAVNCGQVDAALIPCIGYLMGQGGDSPSPSCCAGVRAVKDLAQTTADKRALCSCVKAAAGRSAGLSDRAASVSSPPNVVFNWVSLFLAPPTVTRLIKSVLGTK